MNTLHDTFEKTLARWTEYDHAKRYIFRTALSDKNVELTDQQLTEFLGRLDAGKSQITIDSPNSNIQGQIQIDADDLKRAMERYTTALERAATDSVRMTIEDIAPEIVKDLTLQDSTVLKELQSHTSDFEGTLCHVWGTAIDRLELLVNAAREFNDQITEAIETHTASNTDLDNDQLKQAVRAVHVRACRTSMEIIALLRSGFPDGAYARWRSLHELAITAMFLSEHGNDTASMYLEHSAIDRHRSMESYQKYCETIGYEPFTVDEVANSESEAKLLASKYGKGFTTDYGWACKALGLSRPTFADIEQSLDLDHWRPFYKLACQSIHASAQACFFSLGLSPGERIFSGATLAGLCDPGQNCAISLAMATVPLATVIPTLDHVLAAQVISLLADGVVEAFFQANKFLEDNTVELEVDDS